MSYLIDRIKSKILNYQFSKFSKNMRFNFYLNPKEYISSQIFYYGLHEKKLLEFIFSILPDDYKRGNCLDIGSNIGNHALFFSNFYDRVDAFEPVFSTFKALELNILINGLVGKVHAHNVALSSENLNMRFFEDQSGDIGRSRVVTSNESRPEKTIEYIVQATKGDDFLQEIIDIKMIKIDAEGHESQVIHGLKELISKNHPIILFEANARDESNVINDLKKIGYKYFYSPQIKYFKVKPNILKYFLRTLFEPNFQLINIDNNFNYLSQLSIA